MQLEFPVATTTSLPMIGNRANQYPGYVGASAAYYAWTGLYSGSGASAGGSPVNVPSDAAFFQNHPSQVVQVAVQISDFGSATSADRWVTEQRIDWPPNDVANYGSGVTSNPSTPILGDDTFMYQVDKGAPYSSVPFSGPFVGRVYTNLEVRSASVVYALAIDSGPMVDGQALARRLMDQFLAREASTCAVVTPTLNPSATPSSAPSRGASTPSGTVSTGSSTTSEPTAPGSVATPAA